MCTLFPIHTIEYDNESTHDIGNTFLRSGNTKALTAVRGLECICMQNIFFDIRKGHNLEVHCTNIQRKISIK